MQAADALAVKLAHLTKLHPKVIDMGLARVEALLQKLGNPHHKLPQVIHVAGTNGKGSSIATLHAILKAAGKTCHVMTSPHLIRFNERIVIGGSEITDEYLLDLLNEVENANEDNPITFFEITTVAGLLAFSRAPADYVLLETGMGGRLDATNVIPNPLLTIITMISFDHQQYLGNALTDIAAEKAGIIKAHVACIIGAQTPEALSSGVIKVFKERAAILSAPLLTAGDSWSVTKKDTQLQFQLNNQYSLFPISSLMGDHQIENAGNAIMAAKYISGISDDAIAQGLQSVQWPARLQKIAQHALYIDGGHNDSAGVVLAQQARKWQTADHKPLHLVLGMLSTKEPISFIKPLIPYLAKVTCVSIPDEPLSYTAEALAKLIAPHITCPLNTAQMNMNLLVPPQEDQSRTLVAGSLYLAGWVLKNCR